MMQRPEKAEYYLNIAKEVLKRGTCLRRNYGAVIVNNDEIVGTGYTGSPRGTQNCCDVGICQREELNIPSGERYELCRSIHAEMNAVIHAGRYNCIGATLYITGMEYKTEKLVASTEPCALCRRVIINAGIATVIGLVESGEIVIYPVEQWISDSLK